jgi:outer membrane receptor protein involved in Fe transport
MEIRADRQVAPYTTLRAGYSVNSAYLTAVPPNVQDGTLVIGEQSLGLPLQKGILSIDRRPPTGIEYGASMIYQGFYNGFDQPKFATLSAMLGYRFNKFEVNLAATNLTNVYAYKFTLQNRGIPYGGCCGTGPIPTDAYAMQGTQFMLTVARRY